MMRTNFHRGLARPGFLLTLLAAVCFGALGFRNLDAWLAESPGCVTWERGSADGDSYTINFSAGDFAASRLGDRTGSENDRFELVPIGDSLTLTEGVPTTALVNMGVFRAGVTGQPVEIPFRLVRSLTVNGVTHTLGQPAVIATGMTTDFLRLGEGAPVSFEVPLPGGHGIVDVTPLEQDLWGTLENPTNSEPIHATFLLHNVTAE